MIATVYIRNRKDAKEVFQRYFMYYSKGVIDKKDLGQIAQRLLLLHPTLSYNQQFHNTLIRTANFKN